MPRRFEGLSDKSTLLSGQSERPTNLAQLRSDHHRFRDPQAESHETSNEGQSIFELQYLKQQEELKGVVRVNYDDPEVPRLRGGNWETFLDDAKQAIKDANEYSTEIDFINKKMGEEQSRINASFFRKLSCNSRYQVEYTEEEIKANNEYQRYKRLFDRIKEFKEKISDKTALEEKVARYLLRGSHKRKNPQEGSSTQLHDQAGSSQQPIATANEDNRPYSGSERASLPTSEVGEASHLDITPTRIESNRAWTEFLETTKKVDESCKDWRNFWG